MWVGAQVRQRFRAWWQARLPRTDTLVLTQRNIYIVPTHAGFMFAVTLVVLLLASVNYQLNLGYVLTFLLAGSGIVSMHITHNTLRGLRLHLRAPAPVFAGEAALLDAVLTSPARRALRHRPACRGVGRCRRVELGRRAGRRAGERARELRAAGSAACTTCRRCWSRRAFRSACFARGPCGVRRRRCSSIRNPKDPPPRCRRRTASASGPPAESARASGETEGVRAYRRGDPLKLVVWKKVAKYAGSSGEMVSRDTSGSAHRELWLDYQASAAPGVEQRLSRLTAWVIAADHGGIVYGCACPASSSRRRTARRTGASAWRRWRCGAEPERRAAPSQARPLGGPGAVLRGRGAHIKPERRAAPSQARPLGGPGAVLRGRGAHIKPERRAAPSQALPRGEAGAVLRGRGAHMSLAGAQRLLPQWPGWRRLPREARDTLFLLARDRMDRAAARAAIAVVVLAVHRRRVVVARAAGGCQRTLAEPPARGDWCSCSSAC